MMDIPANAARVDAILSKHDLGAAWENLLAQTLHSCLACTWWARRDDGREWFSMWEGSCYFHSTVDVEFTQAPFYLTIWPELLGLQLEQWTGYLVPGESLLGAAGLGSAYLAHDCGQVVCANECRYQHPMAVEESANFLVLLGVLIGRTFLGHPE
jgi:xylan 1,4-beta-xylosidase